MKIENMNVTPIPQVNGAKADASGPTARDRAIAKLLEGSPSQQPQTTPVKNATQVSPEEFGAIKQQYRAAEGRSDNVEVPSSEPAPAEQKASSEEPLSSQYAVLARKEKALRAREAALRAKEASLNKPQPEAPKAPETDFSKYVDKERLTKDPFTVLSELGLGYDQLTEMAMNAPKANELQMMNTIKQLTEKLNKLEIESGTVKKSFEESQNLQREQGVKQIRSEAQNLIKNDPQFETIRETGSLDDVVELITREYDDTGYLMSVEEAAVAVEEHLVEEALRLTKLKKIQQKLAPAQPVQSKQQTAQSEKQPLKTLTNSVASTRPLSGRERAILAFQNKLNKS